MQVATRVQHILAAKSLSNLQENLKEVSIASALPEIGQVNI
jgi:hypothetical protein